MLLIVRQNQIPRPVFPSAGILTRYCYATEVISSPSNSFSDCNCFDSSHRSFHSRLGTSVPNGSAETDRGNHACEVGTSRVAAMRLDPMNYPGDTLNNETVPDVGQRGLICQSQKACWRNPLQSCTPTATTKSLVKKDPPETLDMSYVNNTMQAKQTEPYTRILHHNTYIPYLSCSLLHLFSNDFVEIDP
nr:hypothetical protein CFP56_60222 [Quercus suber]